MTVIQWCSWWLELSKILSLHGLQQDALLYENFYFSGQRCFLGKLQIKTEQRKFSINPFEKNQEAGIGSLFEIKNEK